MRPNIPSFNIAIIANCPGVGLFSEVGVRSTYICISYFFTVIPSLSLWHESWVFVGTRCREPKGPRGKSDRLEDKLETRGDHESRGLISDLR